MPKVKWASGCGLLPVGVEDESLHDELGRIVDMLGRLPEESTSAGVTTGAASQPDGGPTSVGARHE